MKQQIVETTDGKYIGLIFDDAQKGFISPDGIPFTPTKIQDLGDGYIRYSNTHYVVLAKGLE